jgi:hypothetical protein
MLLRLLPLAALALGLLACAVEPIEQTDFDPPGDTDTSQEPLPAGQKPEPVADCAGVANYTECSFDQAAGVCIFGKCRRACQEDVDCDDGSACTEDACFWGYCVNDAGTCG